MASETMEMQEEIAILYVPCGSEEEAASITRVLLAERLVACGNIYPSRSLYMWQGKLVDSAEYVVFAKTTMSMADRAARRIGELHSYEVPCVLTIEPTAANREYAEWVAAQVSAGRHVTTPVGNNED